tara:strand:+ start:1906 stop:2790 length:885 start_codon:yes stop_codon:yes gene_type:complete
MNTAVQLFLSSFRFVSFSKIIDDLENETVALLKTVVNNYSDDSYKEFVENMFKLNGSWEPGLQQDCHECIIYILDFLDINLRTPEDKNRSKRKVSLGKDYDEVMASFGQFYWNEHTYRMHQIVKCFHGLYRSSTTCSCCKKENNKWDLFGNITMTTEYKNFNDWIENFGNEEEIQDYDCEHCKKKTKAARQIEVWRFPKTLILHSISKTFNTISTELKVKEPVHGECEYILKGIVFHDGPDLESGHYYCSVFRNDKWWIISDQNVYGPIDPRKELSVHVKRTYILLYERTLKKY